jgi:hypothetical protein
LDVLLAEYSALKSEILVQVGLYNQQSRFVQLYGGLLFGFTASYLAFLRLMTPANATEKGADLMVVVEGVGPTVFWVIVLIIAASVAFYFVSSVMSHAYMFRILRMRMASIESRINNLLGGDDILIYESKIAPHFLEHKQYGVGSYTPYALSGFWRLVMLAFFMAILVILGFLLLPMTLALVYLLLLVIGGLFHVQQYISLLSGEGYSAISKYFSHNELDTENDG